jgi:hypothetical protein
VNRSCLANDRQIAASSRAPEDPESIRRIGSSATSNVGTLEDLLDLVRAYSMACQVLDVIVVPFKF